MSVDECFQLGYVIKNHGLKGEVNIQLDVDYPDEYRNLESVFVEINEKLVPFFITNIQIRGDKAVVKFEDVDDLASADPLKSKALFLPLSVLPKLGQDQFYYHDIIGYKIIDQDGFIIGDIADVYTSSRQDLFAVKSKDDKEVLIPVIDEIIVEVNHKERQLKVNLPDGLLDIYLG